jgi:ribulokinase
MFLLGLDYGTGGAKACLIDEGASLKGYSFREYPIIQQHPGWSEHDANLYWEIACTIIGECMSQAGCSGNDIAGIAVSSALPCLVMVDKNGDPIHNAYNLMDKRAVEEVQWVKDNIGEERVFKITGNRLEDHPSLVNLLWERKNRGEDFKRIDKVLTIEGFINFKLTGVHSLVHQNAVFHGAAYNLRTKQYDEKLLEDVGIDKSIYPDLYYCRQIIGEVTQKAASETGLSSGIPVAAGQADFNAACVASGVIAEGDVQMNLGTCGNFGIIHTDTDFMYEMIALGFTVNSENTYITIPTTTTGGMSIRYLRDTFGQAEGQAADALGLDVYDLLNLQAQKAPLGSDGLIVLPFLMGERTPIWDVHARGCIFGLSLNHTKGHLIRATMEGVAYALYDSFRLIKEADRKVNAPIVMHEGGAKSVLWRQIVTDVFNVPTVLTKERTGAPYGDAILAGVATGIFENFEVGKKRVEYIQPMEPDKANHERYMEYFKLFKSIYSHVKSDYRELAKLRDLK